MVVLIRRSFKVDSTVTLFHWRREGEGEGEGREEGRGKGEGRGGREGRGEGGEGRVDLFLDASCYRNTDKLRPDGPLGSYVNFTLTCH